MMKRSRLLSAFVAFLLFFGFAAIAATPVTQENTYDRISRGLVDGQSVVHKFGRGVVGTSFVPIAFGNIYRTPQPANATALRVKAGDANDTAAGTGAREVMVQGLSATGGIANRDAGDGWRKRRSGQHGNIYPGVPCMGFQIGDICNAVGWLPCRQCRY